MSYGATTRLDQKYGDSRSMSFMVSSTDDDGHLAGCRHDLVIAPMSYELSEISRDALVPMKRGFFREIHPSEIIRVQMSGSCGRMLREMEGGTYQTDGFAILRSLKDLFLSISGFYEDKKTGKYVIRGVERWHPVDPAKVELRWYNWGFNIESISSNDLDYWVIVPDQRSFSIRWNAKEQRPTWNISFVGTKPMEANQDLDDNIAQFFEKNKIFPDVIEGLKDSGAWPWWSVLATRMQNKAVPVINTLANLRISMMRQQHFGGSVPFEYWDARTMWDDFGDMFDGIR